MVIYANSGMMAKLLIDHGANVKALQEVFSDIFKDVSLHNSSFNDRMDAPSYMNF